MYRVIVQLKDLDKPYTMDNIEDSFEANVIADKAAHGMYCDLDAIKRIRVELHCAHHGWAETDETGLCLDCLDEYYEQQERSHHDRMSWL